MFCFGAPKTVNHLIMWINELHCWNQGFLGKSLLEKEFLKYAYLLHTVIA